MDIFSFAEYSEVNVIMNDLINAQQLDLKDIQLFLYNKSVIVDITSSKYTLCWDILVKQSVNLALSSYISIHHIRRFLAKRAQFLAKLGCKSKFSLTKLACKNKLSNVWYMNF